MSRFSEHRDFIVTFRVTASQRADLDALAAADGMGLADFIREALDHYVEARRRKSLRSKGDSSSGSSARPSSSKANVKATAKVSPSNRQTRTQEPH